MPDYRTWRDAVVRSEDVGVDVIFGYDHVHKPFVELTSEGPILLPVEPDVNNFEGWTALASWAEITTRVLEGDAGLARRPMIISLGETPGTSDDGEDGKCS